MLVLASASPRRRELLSRAAIEFEVCVSDVVEQRREDEDPVAYARRLAYDKAAAVLRTFETCRSVRVLGADTVVVIDRHLLEKPLDAADAERMLRLLSGRTHEVTTAVCLLCRDDSGVRPDIQHATTRVCFRRLSDQQIRDYIATGEPFDKAGAYGIQGRAAAFIESYDGDYDNIVGLPVALVKEMLFS